MNEAENGSRLVCKTVDRAGSRAFFRRSLAVMVIILGFVLLSTGRAMPQTVPSERLYEDPLAGSFDLNGDKFVDKEDIKMLLADRNKSVDESKCGKPCDLDEDGTITVNDVRMLTFKCTFAGCITDGIKDFSPGKIKEILGLKQVKSAEEFVDLLPREFKENWILMSRSESLQTGTATSPRILLPSQNSAQVFSLTLQKHDSFPLAEPNTIEYMQWDGTKKQFGFHEINLATGQVSENDAKCPKCHSGRPNWDAYDSWGGMLPFNRDRVYKGSVEAAALRKLFNLSNKSDAIRPVLERLTLPKGMERLNDGSIYIPFDGPKGTVVEIEPAITAVTSPDSKVPVSYFPPTEPATDVRQGGGSDTSDFLRLSNSLATMLDEGRGVDLFDHLAEFNAHRIAQELIDHHKQTPRPPVDVRPIALAIAGRDDMAIAGRDARRDCVTEADIGIDRKFVTAEQRKFFDFRNGMNLDRVFHDTLARRESLPRRKADIQRLNLMGTDGNDRFVDKDNAGLIGAYGPFTTSATDKTVPKIRQEVFRRPLDTPGRLDPTTGRMIDREEYEEAINTKIALFRYFLEPLGVPVDKWSMSVRGRSRTYTFADVFGFSAIGVYLPIIAAELRESLYKEKVFGSHDDFCKQVIEDSQKQFDNNLPPADAPPTYADVQKIFDRNCTECHSLYGGRTIPPYFPRNTTILSAGVSFPLAKALSGQILDLIRRPETDSNVMPLGGPKLSETDITTIRRWIKAEMPQ